MMVLVTKQWVWKHVLPRYSQGGWASAQRRWEGGGGEGATPYFFQKNFKFGKILFFHSWWNELSGVAETFAVSESAVVALLLQLRLPPPPVAPITAGGAVSPSGSFDPPASPHSPVSPHHFFLLLWLRQTGGSEVTWWRFLCGSVTSPQLRVSVLSMAMMRQYTMWVVAATRWPPPKNCYLAPLGALYAMMRPNWLDTEPSNISLSPYFLHFFLIFESVWRSL